MGLKDRAAEDGGVLIERGSAGAGWFRDARGVAYEVVPGFARTLFEGNRAVAPIVSGYPSVGSGEAGGRTAALRGARARVRLGERLLGTLAPGAKGDEVLVVGAGDGGECLWLAGEGAGRVTGIDLSPGDPIGGELWEAFAAMDGRAMGRGELETRIGLVRGDICASSLPEDSFDRMYSWQTLEHIMDPAAAFDEIARLLRPGGAAYIEYNPFFSVDGAHWAGTIDIPWAHARLDHDDYQRAQEILHPDRPAYACSFVRDGINRLSQSRARAHALAAGLTVAALLPRVRTEDALVLDATIAGQVYERFPDSEPIDLLSRIVRMVLVKPGG